MRWFPPFISHSLQGTGASLTESTRRNPRRVGMRQVWQGRVVTKWGPALTGPLIVGQESPIKLQGPCAGTNVYSRIGHQEQQMIGHVVKGDHVIFDCVVSQCWLTDDLTVAD